LDDGKVKVITQVEGQKKEFILLPEELEIRYLSKDGFGVESAEGLVVALDLQITDALKLEGQARDIVRVIQDLRKNADYNVEDRIIVSLSGADIIVQKFTDYIKKETLANDIVSKLDNPDQIQQIDEIEIAVKKV